MKTNKVKYDGLLWDVAYNGPSYIKLKRKRKGAKQATFAKITPGMFGY